MQGLSPQKSCLTLQIKMDDVIFGSLQYLKFINNLLEIQILWRPALYLQFSDCLMVLTDHDKLMFPLNPEGVSQG